MELIVNKKILKIFVFLSRFLCDDEKKKFFFASSWCLLGIDESSVRELDGLIVDFLMRFLESNYGNVKRKFKG